MTSKEIGARINARMKELNMTQVDVANAVGVNKSTIQRYISGSIINIKLPVIESIAKALNCSPSWLVGKSDKMNTSRKGVNIPVYGNVAAGIPLEAITDIEDFEEISPEMAAVGEYAALRIHGDSMEPRMTDGDVVIVRLQPDIESGDTAIVIINGSDATCKRVQKTPDGILLISINPAYSPMFYSNKQIEELPVRIFGKVVELRAKF